MKIFGRDPMCYSSDGIEDICCKKFERAYEEEDIMANRYAETIVFRAYNLYLDEYNDYELKYCPFCGKKIKYLKAETLKK